MQRKWSPVCDGAALADANPAIDMNLDAIGDLIETANAAPDQLSGGASIQIKSVANANKALN